MKTCQGCKSRQDSGASCGMLVGMWMSKKLGASWKHPPSTFGCTLWEGKPVEFKGVVSDYANTWIKIRLFGKLPVLRNRKVRVRMEYIEED